MLSRYVIPYNYLAEITADRLHVLERYGLEPQSLIAYSLTSISCDASMEYEYLSSHISKDLIEILPDVRYHASEYQRLLHQCIDCAFELRQRILDIVRSFTNNPNLTRRQLQFEQFHGDDISVLVAA